MFQVMYSLGDPLALSRFCIASETPLHFPGFLEKIIGFPNRNDDHEILPEKTGGQSNRRSTTRRMVSENCLLPQSPALFSNYAAMS